MSDVRVAADRTVEFFESVPLFFRNYTNFRDRSSRGALWWAVAFIGLTFVVLTVIDAVIAPRLSYGLFSPAFGAAMLVPSASVGVRRLHDTGRSGWWMLLTFVPLGVLALFAWFAEPGDRQDNKYADDREAGR